jgi:hypothetical protein
MNWAVEQKKITMRIAEDNLAEVEAMQQILAMMSYCYISAIKSVISTGLFVVYNMIILGI